MAYTSPDLAEITIVIEKMDANQSGCQRGQRPSSQINVTQPENATFVLSSTSVASLRTRMAVWRSNFATESAGTEQLFMRAPDAHLNGGVVTLEIQPNWAYTLTTMATGGKGVTQPPPAKRFPQTYGDNFETCPLGSIPTLVAPMAGAFECVNAGGGREGRSVRQVSPAKAICDRGDVTPYAVLGDGCVRCLVPARYSPDDAHAATLYKLCCRVVKCGDCSHDCSLSLSPAHSLGLSPYCRFRTSYNISIDYLLSAALGGVFIGARAKGPVGAGTGMDGIFLAVNGTGFRLALSVIATNGSSVTPDRIVLEGAIQGANRDGGSAWRRLTLEVAGQTATALLDGKPLFANVTIPAPHGHHTSTVANKVVRVSS